ncbi:homoserine kinase [Candidatus Bathyarchaeota archaeon]|nr:homoserine kinase [Candidatus Bathyarchaeota archaeon]
MPLSRVTVRAPATTANLGPGFDVFGLALEQPSDKVTVILIPQGVKIEVTGLSAATIPTAPEKNTAGVVANQMLKEFSLKAGVLIKIEKGILPGMGLGSSAASAAAVAYGLNRMFDLKLDNTQLIRLAAKGEVASAGSEHADNVSAAICGDFVIIKSYNPIEIVNLKSPPDMEVCVAFPHMVTPSNKTEKARSVVSKLVPIDKLVHNVGKAAAMATGFAIGDVDLIGGSMSDAVAEPARAFLIPGYEQVKENALKAGACGVAVSGAGPAMIAIVNKKKADASKIASAMKEGFESAGLNATAFATKPGKGVRLLEMK